MSTKKMQKTLDTVKGDVRELAEAFWAFRDELITQQAVTAAESHAPKGDTLATGSSDMPATGHMALFGSYEMANGGSGTHLLQWAMQERPIEEVLGVEIEGAAGVLSAIGHRQRLGIVLMLIRQAATANEIVSGLSLGTTGAAYHHLNVLQGAGLIRQAERGVFSITPERVPSLIAILSGLSGLIEMTIEDRPLPAGAGQGDD